MTLGEVVQKRLKVKLKRKQSERCIGEEPATKLSRLEVEMTAVDTNGIGASSVPSDDEVEKSSAGSRRKMEAAIAEDETTTSVGKKLQKFLKQGIKRKLKKIIITKKPESAESERMLSYKSEDRKDAHPKKKRKGFKILKDKIRVMKKTKESQGTSKEKFLGQDVKQRESQTTKDIRKVLQHQLVLKRLKKKSKGHISETAQELDSTSSSKVNAQTAVKDKISQEATPGSSGVFKERCKTSKVKASTLVCELDKISETKTRTSWTSDIDDIFACLE